MLEKSANCISTIGRIPSMRRADRSADHRVFADRRVQDAPGKLFGQTFRRLERAAEFSGDVLAVNEDALVLAQSFACASRIASR